VLWSRFLDIERKYLLRAAQSCFSIAKHVNFIFVFLLLASNTKAIASARAPLTTSLREAKNVSATESHGGKLELQLEQGD
jgi:hypothetical protein